MANYDTCDYIGLETLLHNGVDTLSGFNVLWHVIGQIGAERGEFLIFDTFIDEITPRANKGETIDAFVFVS
jgi:hypothetical protein